MPVEPQVSADTSIVAALHNTYLLMTGVKLLHGTDRCVEFSATGLRWRIQFQDSKTALVVPEPRTAVDVLVVWRPELQLETVYTGGVVGVVLGWFPGRTAFTKQLVLWDKVLGHREFLQLITKASAKLIEAAASTPPEPSSWPLNHT